MSTILIAVGSTSKAVVLTGYVVVISAKMFKLSICPCIQPFVEPLSQFVYLKCCSPVDVVPVCAPVVSATVPYVSSV